MCIFCRIAEGELPASVVYNDDKAIAFLEIQPITPGHVLIIPKKHAKRLIELSPEDAGHMMWVGQIVGEGLRHSDLLCQGVNYIMSDGMAAGQDVDHVHLHVFPRFEGDGFEMCMENALQKQPGRDLLNEQAEQIIDAMNQLVWNPVKSPINVT
jgi:histidine triad (HIT) family protein